MQPGQHESVTFDFSPSSENINYSNFFTINYTVDGTSDSREVDIAATIVSEEEFENTFIYEFEDLTLESGEYQLISEGGISGNVILVAPDFVHTNEQDFFSITDLAIFFTREPDFDSEIVVQIGGDEETDYESLIRYNWDEDQATEDVARVITTREIDPSLNLSSLTMWVVNAFENVGNPTGTWNGRIAFLNAEELIAKPFVNNRINDEGWYIFSSPKVYTSIEELLDGLWTQCFDGVYNQSSFCDNIPAGQTTSANVITYNGGDNVWQAVESADGLIPPGTAIATYVYETQDPLGSQAATDFGSFSIDLNGFPFINDLTVNIAQDQFKLLGNPYDFSIYLQNVTSGDFNNITGIVYRLNDGATGYDTYDVTAPSGSFEINTFDGFFVESDGSNSSFTFSTSLGDPTKQQPLAEEPAFVHLHLENEYVSAKTSFRIVDGAGPHRPGARYLTPPATPHISMVSHLDDDHMIVRYLPSGLTDDITIPISINSRYEGSVIIRSEITTSVPADWGFVLFDHLTGNRYNLRDQNLPEIEISEMDGITERFELHVTPFSDEIGGTGLPSDFALAQNYPNPFNPATTIQYELPQDTEVRLDVFSIEGRQISTLVNNRQPAGTHNVSFDASNLASGIYIYRLQAGQLVLTRKMVLLK
ncbi:MAG: T9SS C-terminal target domain-containing protein [Balneolaceae bacterium]|nr:MAG: T9SS C-terminal target domain-containing protein [Balneolaceae bacterium]